MGFLDEALRWPHAKAALELWWEQILNTGTDAQDSWVHLSECSAFCPQVHTFPSQVSREGRQACQFLITQRDQHLCFSGKLYWNEPMNYQSTHHDGWGADKLWPSYSSQWCLLGDVFVSVTIKHYFPKLSPFQGDGRFCRILVSDISSPPSSITSFDSRVILFSFSCIVFM